MSNFFSAPDSVIDFREIAGIFKDVKTIVLFKGNPTAINIETTNILEEYRKWAQSKEGESK